MFTSIDDRFDHIDPDINLDINPDRCKYSNQIKFIVKQIQRHL